MMVWIVIVTLLHLIVIVCVLCVPRLIFPILRVYVSRLYREFKSSILLTSLIALLSLIAIKNQSLFEFLVFMAMWVQVEVFTLRGKKSLNPA